MVSLKDRESLARVGSSCEWRSLASEGAGRGLVDWAESALASAGALIAAVAAVAAPAATNWRREIERLCAGVLFMRSLSFGQVTVPSGGLGCNKILVRQKG